MKLEDKWSMKPKEYLRFIGKQRLFVVFIFLN